jgi:hypothetical protein
MPLTAVRVIVHSGPRSIAGKVDALTVTGRAFNLETRITLLTTPGNPNDPVRN